MIIVTNKKEYLKAQKQAKYGEVIIWNENLTKDTNNTSKENKK